MAQAVRKKSSVGSARQPSLALSKEVDLAAISYVRRAPPTSPLVWARSAMTAKVSLLLNLLSSSCIQFNAKKLANGSISGTKVGGSTCINAAAHQSANNSKIARNDFV